MRCSKVLLGLILSVSFLFGTNCGKDDSTNPGPNVPASLVGTWLYNSATRNGAPIGSFAEVSYTDTSEAGSCTFNSNATWSGAETYHNQVVYTMSGTFTVNDDLLTLTRLIIMGTARPANDTVSSLWNVNSDTLTITNQITAVPPDTITVIVKYLKE